MTNLLEEIRALVPMIAARSTDIETARRLPADLALALARTGVFRMLVPRERGGLQVSPRELFEVLETLGSADASVGWCAMIAATSGLTSAYLPPAVAAQVFHDPLTVTGGVFAPMGKAILDGGRLYRHGQVAMGLWLGQLSLADGWLCHSGRWQATLAPQRNAGCPDDALSGQRCDTHR